MTTEAVKIARENRKAVERQQLLSLAKEIASNPVIALVAGVALTEFLYRSDMFGDHQDDKFVFDTKSGASTWARTSFQTKNNIETAIYVASVARAIAPVLPQVVSLGETAITTVGKLASPLVAPAGMITTALKGV